MDTCMPGISYSKHAVDIYQYEMNWKQERIRKIMRYQDFR